MLQTGEAQLLSPFPTSRPHCWRKTKISSDGQSVNYAALYQYERDAKAVDNPKVREALNYAINRPALVKLPLRAMQRQLLVWYRQVSPRAKL